MNAREVAKRWYEQAISDDIAAAKIAIAERVQAYFEHRWGTP